MKRRAHLVRGRSAVTPTSLPGVAAVRLGLPGLPCCTLCHGVRHFVGHILRLRWHLPFHLGGLLVTSVSTAVMLEGVKCSAVKPACDRKKKLFEIFNVASNYA